MKIIPLGDRLLVKQFIEEGEKSKGGLIIESGKVKRNKGTVIRIGNQVSNIKAKDTIIFGQYAGTDIKDDDGFEFLIIKEEEILAVIEK